MTAPLYPVGELVTCARWRGTFTVASHTPGLGWLYERDANPKAPLYFLNRICTCPDCPQNFSPYLCLESEITSCLVKSTTTRE